jgi:hypothetical protein
MMFAYHIDSTTLADGDYQLIPEPEGDISEDPGRKLLVLTSLTPAPPAKATPDINRYFYYAAIDIFIYIYLCI